jgi:hypothetical protein
VIRVLGRLERDLRHPVRARLWLGVFSVMVALVVAHVAHDIAHAEHAGELVCIAFAVGAVVRRLVSPPERFRDDFPVLGGAVPRPTSIVGPAPVVSTRASPAPAPLLL